MLRGFGRLAGGTWGTGSLSQSGFWWESAYSDALLILLAPFVQG